MEHKTNYIQEDLIKSFRVFDGDDLNTVNKDELKVVMMNLIGKDLASEDQIDAMFREAEQFIEKNEDGTVKQVH